MVKNMKQKHKIAKEYLMSLSPIEAYELIEKYKIPTPYKELFEIVCIRRLKGYKIIDVLEEKYLIKMPYWTMIKEFDTALDMFYKSNQYFIKKE